MVYLFLRVLMAAATNGRAVEPNRTKAKPNGQIAGLEPLPKPSNVSTVVARRAISWLARYTAEVIPVVGI